MTESDCITPWLHHLRILMPPNGVILVGAGAGTGPWVQMLQEWGVPGVTLVVGDGAQFQHLQRSVGQRDGWRLRNEVVAAQTETVTYHHASNSNESGLLESESLRSLWPNIQTRQTEFRQAIALTELQQDADTPANWLMVDCLPALPIIQGVADQLDAFDIITVRILLGMASQHELEHYLNGRGYRCVATDPDRHPAVGHALFVRDTLVLIRNLRQQQIEQLKQADQLIQAKAAAEKLEVESRKHLEQLTQTKGILEKRASENQQLLAEQRKRYQKLETEHTQTMERLNSLQQEFLKAEAQTQLIKELLLPSQKS